jgi:hypothetical protein
VREGVSSLSGASPEQCTRFDQMHGVRAPDVRSMRRQHHLAAARVRPLLPCTVPIGFALIPGIAIAGPVPAMQMLVLTHLGISGPGTAYRCPPIRRRLD